MTSFNWRYFSIYTFLLVYWLSSVWQVKTKGPVYVYWWILRLLYTCADVLGNETIWFRGLYGSSCCIFSSDRFILYIQVCFIDLILCYYCRSFQFCNLLIIWTVLFSGDCRFARVGSVVLALHDASDVFLELGKMSKYSGAEAVASCSFVLFVFFFTLLRLIYYPFWILRSTRSVAFVPLPILLLLKFFNNFKMLGS